MIALALWFLCTQEPLPVLHEESVLASELPGNVVFGLTLELAGDRLALTGFGGASEELHVLRRDGSEWIRELELLNSDLPVSYDRCDFDGERLLLASGENQFAVTYRRTGDTWARDGFIPHAAFGGLHGQRLATTVFLGSPADASGVQVWKETATGRELDAIVRPPAPQVSGSCCAPVDIWGNTLAFVARDAAGRPSIHVHVRSGGAWQPEAELWPASGGVDVWDLRLVGGKLAALVLERAEAPGATAFVFERTRGAWTQVARLFPERVGSLDLDRDTLVLGQSFDEAGAGVAVVVERNGDRWIPTHELRASDGWSLGTAVALEARTVAVSSQFDPLRPGRTYLFRLPALARVNSYGCGVNLAGSLVWLDGWPALGHDLTLGVDDPSHTRLTAVPVLLGLSSRPSAHHPCGSLLPRAGLAGGPGEFLLRGDDLFPIQTLFAGTFVPPGPLPVTLRIPASPTLVGHTFYLQAALGAADPDAGSPWGLTSALELTIGR